MQIGLPSSLKLNRSHYTTTAKGYIQRPRYVIGYDIAYPISCLVMCSEPDKKPYKSEFNLYCQSGLGDGNIDHIGFPHWKNKKST